MLCITNCVYNLYYNLYLLNIYNVGAIKYESTKKYFMERKNL